MSDKDEISALKLSLSHLRQEFSSRSLELEQRIQALEQHIPYTTPASHSQAKARVIQSSPERPKAIVIQSSGDFQAARTTQTVPTAMTKPLTEKPAAAAALNINPAAEMRESVFTQILNTQNPLLQPLSDLMGKIWAFYQHYKNQGKAPVFFMTLAGILALVLGFGYLLQYSFHEYLNPMGKVGLGFLAAIAVTFGGLRLCQQKSEMSEFGSSVIALGLILNYLCAYFAGPYFKILPDLWGFGLLCIVTLCAYLLALRYETRIVALVTLIGGACAPILLGQIDQTPEVYGAYLLVLTLASLVLSVKIPWEPLAYTTLLLSTGLLEMLVLQNTASEITAWLWVAILHGFFYLFAAYALYQVRQSKTVSKQIVLLLSLNSVFFLFGLYQLMPNSLTLGISYTLNLIPWLLVGLAAQRMTAEDQIPANFAESTREKIQMLSLLHAGLLLGAAILVLINPEAMALIWGVESILLFYLGRRYNYASVRAEAHILGWIAAAQALVQTLSWSFDQLHHFRDLSPFSLDMGWVNLIFLLLLSGSFVWIKDQQGYPPLGKQELKLGRVYDEFFSVFISAGFLLTVALLWLPGVWFLSLLPICFLIFRSQRKNLPYSEWIGLAHYGLWSIPITLSIYATSEWGFMDQTLMGKAARIMAFLSLWLIPQFYARFCPQARGAAEAVKLERFFFLCLPLCFLPSVIRHQPDYLPLAIWLSAAIALAQYHYQRGSILKNEFRFLVVLAALGNCLAGLIFVSNHWPSQAFSGLALGTLFFAGLMAYERRLQRSPQQAGPAFEMQQSLHALASFGLYYFGIALSLGIYAWSLNQGLGLASGLLYFSLLLHYQQPLRLLRKSYFAVYHLCWAFLVSLGFWGLPAVLGLAPAYNPLLKTAFLILGGISGAALVYRSSAPIRAVWLNLRPIPKEIYFWGYHLYLCFCYVQLYSLWLPEFMGPAISISGVLQATILLFQTLQARYRPLLSLSIVCFGIAGVKIVFFDMQGFSMIQKILAFMVIGALLLGGAYQYQKLRPAIEEV